MIELVLFRAYFRHKAVSLYPLLERHFRLTYPSQPQSILSYYPTSHHIRLRLATMDQSSNQNAPSQNQRPGHRDMMFCHECADEWYRDEHGLSCPECGSDFTEIVSSAAEISFQLPRHEMKRICTDFR